MTSTNSAGLPLIGGNRWPNPSDIETAEIAELIAQRDKARDLFAHIEEEHERLARKVDEVRDYVQELVGQWATNTVALDILTILDGPHDPTPYSGDFPTIAAYEAVNGPVES